MRKVGLAEMSAFVAIAERLSFAKAATHLGVSRSALSETIRSLEEKLGVRLLNRTTRSVSLTEIGQRLLDQLRPVLDNFEEVVESVNAFRDKPTGHLRLTVPRPAARKLIAPMLSGFLKTHPGVTLEISVDSSLVDIVRDRFDAGIRPGHRVDKDMIAVRLGDDARPTIVASPEYLDSHPRIVEPADLRGHNCIRQRFASGAITRWVFEKQGESIDVAVTGSLITSDGDLAVRAALEGVGVARVPGDAVAPLIADEKLHPLLQDWQPKSVGFYLYYPSRRQVPAALQAFIEFAKARARSER